MVVPEDILLAGETNELEIIVFKVGEESFGINVLQVREIIQPLSITKIPKAHENIEGMIRLREEVIPVVNLAKALNLPSSKNQKNDKMIVTELNQMSVAFYVHHVSRIHRISWDQIEKSNDLSTDLKAYASGIIKLEDEMAILLDFEKILSNINPKVDIKG